MSLKTHNLGYPRVGARRELKKALESYWAGRSTQQELRDTAAALRKAHWITQRDAGIEWIPSNDFSFYDQTLDASVLFGVVPARFAHSPGRPVDLDTYFTMARGIDTENHATAGVAALEMTKWFDTNYHYLVPEFAAGQTFALSSSKPLEEYREALALGIKTTPVLLGPVSFLMLGKAYGENPDDLKEMLLRDLLPIYADLLGQLKSAGAEWAQIDEPCLCLDLTDRQRRWYDDAYRMLAGADTPKLLLATYFGELRDNLPLACRLPIDGLHIDAVRAPQEVERVCDGLRDDVLLSVGVVDGRNIWRNDFARSLDILRTARESIGADRLIVSPSCSLLHSPYSLKYEKAMDAEIKSWLAFAEEKLGEVKTLARLAGADGAHSELDAALRENRAMIAARRTSARIHDGAAQARLAMVCEDDWRRATPFAERVKAQQAHLNLPLFPTTTIGSFPQTAEVRGARARFKSGELSAEQYDAFLEEQTRDAVRWQEELGVDVLVHGEFERNDMVEYFGERLSGFVFTQNGWVQSYGSRCVKPPVIFGDVSRPAPMTLRWSEFAQSLTKLPMKGMLTGPITILQWSFVRDDQPRSVTARQIALALRDEVRDLEASGISVIQIDEPALREGLPLRRADRDAYLDWAVAAFRLASSGVRDQTQIHTHMCYCDFNDIIQSIADLDADVISIETARSQSELLEAFAQFQYPNDIGPGVWDIHSPRAPSAREMLALLQSYAEVVSPERLWVNPDCGLKTRGWEEVRPAMRHLIECAREARRKWEQ
ncbi:5-methyltetrahydropteroyltriglutamate--homocysteine methyltransferase [Capsulimonas corticalis]|uniref:5-methyltetrahydropteroyltriglutamate--homocysteine methyltransferase n=1 Tax=Capsulimonas corticalis TaxID=2219043 RepID=A0A402CTI3_9BACT|nr:5-methyltetrahydropteroyltriglutamate--homocysteine S-methyltransferase [Capsulimonas corticalis]BDI30721.1 5-methyltetrahydropteroyltriglutamate--homocysteine methyltransferase [Capsulimonas corticalis]